MTAQLISNTTGILNLSDDGKVSLSGTNASFTLPNYATGSLPSGNEGDVVFNSSTLEVIVYNGSAWQNIDTPIPSPVFVFHADSSSSGYTIGDTTTVMFLNLAGNNNFSYSITLPASPTNLQIIDIAVGGSFGITSISLQANSGQTLFNVPSPLGPTGRFFRVIYQTSNTTWYPIGL